MAVGHSTKELVARLGGPDESAARRAVAEIMARFPMTALPERWTDDTPYEPPDSSVVPGWLLDAGSGWDSGNEFINFCADQAEQLPGWELDQFFTRMAALLGISRLFTAVLRQRDRDELATRFILRLAHTRMRQFPPQLCFSPTLRCQLNCSYCISAGTAEKTGIREPDQAGVDSLLDWMARQGIRRLGLSGGEPTLSPLFPYLAGETARRKMSLYMASNGMFPNHICGLIAERNVASLTLHLTGETIASPEKRTIFVRNARTLIDRGINIALRCNLTDHDLDPKIFAESGADSGIREIRVAVPTPNAQHGNEYVEPDMLRNFGDQLARLHSVCDGSSISLHLAKPFPLCLLPEATARYFLGNGSAAINCPMHQNDFSNNIVVHPDFSFIPCLGLSIKQHKPIMEYDNLREAARSFTDRIIPLIRKPLFKHCPGCPLWKGSRCIGACLSYRLPVTADQPDHQ